MSYNVQGVITLGTWRVQRGNDDVIIGLNEQARGATGDDLQISKVPPPLTRSLTYKYWAVDQTTFSISIYFASNSDFHT